MTQTLKTNYLDFEDKKVLNTDEYRKWWKQLIAEHCHFVKDMPIDSLQFLEVNANVMGENKMARLQENLEYDGGSTQPPLVQLLPNGKYEIISGNHRVRASANAGIETISVLAFDCRIPHDEAKRLEISHNTIKGNIVENILQEIISGMKSVETIKLSGSDFDMSNIKFEKIDFRSIDDNGIDFKEVTFVFTSIEESNLQTLLDNIAKSVTKKNSLYIQDIKRYDQFLDTLITMKWEHNIKSNAVAMNVILDFVSAHPEELANFIENSK